MNRDESFALALWVGAVTGFLAYGWLRSIEIRRAFRRAWMRIPAERRAAIRNTLLAEEGIG